MGRSGEFFVKDISNIFFDFITFSWKYETKREIFAWTLILQAIKFTTMYKPICWFNVAVLVCTPEVSHFLGQLLAMDEMVFLENFL